MNNMINFRLTLQLATPFFSQHRITLDSLLSAAVFNATGLQGEDTIPHIPLAMEDGIFKASSIFCIRNYRHSTVGRVMSLRTENDLAAGLFSPNRRGDKYGPIDQQRGDYKANMSAYPGIDAREVYFWGVGNPERVVELILDFIPGIGKRANAGAGQIIAADWLETDSDLSWMTASGHPARPLPVDLWKRIGGTDMPSAALAVQLPYWQTDKVEAVVPMSLVVS